LHVDALRITEYFQRHLTEVEVLEADNIAVQTADGEVAGLVLDGGATVSAGLYVDCTGFARAVLKRGAEPEIMPYEANVNRAVTASVPYVDAVEETAPYTKAHAHEH